MAVAVITHDINEIEGKVLNSTACELKSKKKKRKKEIMFWFNYIY